MLVGDAEVAPPGAALDQEATSAVQVDFRPSLVMPRIRAVSRGLPCGPVASHRVGSRHQLVHAAQSGAPWASVAVKRLPVQLTAMRATTPVESVTS